ncbi:methylenetetrahydrofolate reductase family protein, partial [Vibrio parahaemolyticus V-223/04]
LSCQITLMSRLSFFRQAAKRWKKRCGTLCIV